MSFVEWASCVLPLLAIGWGCSVVAIHPELLDRWGARIDAWRLGLVAGFRRHP